jgi:hypothetical protein
VEPPIPRLRKIAIHCPKEHAKYRRSFRAPDGTDVFAGLRIAYCERCQAFWLVIAVRKGTPMPKSVRQYGSLIRTELEKVELMDQWPYVKELKGRRKTDLIEAVRRRARRELLTTPSFETIERVLNFLAEAGEKISLVVDGVVRRIKENGESFILFPDPFGIDPPLGIRYINCPGCNRKYCTDDMVAGSRIIAWIA